MASRLSAAYPSFRFMGEETYKPGDILSPDPTFVIDPIDGTTNFVHGFPGACISAGLAINRMPAVGVVFNPYEDVLFSAIQGRGAWMVRHAQMCPPSEVSSNESGKSPSTTNMALWGTHEGNPHAYKLPLSTNVPALGQLSTAMVAIEWGSDRAGANFELKLRAFERLSRRKEEGGAMAQGIRSLGSAALNLCKVAAGQVDVYWEGGCWAWDVCAGWCVLSEAGGLMASGNPGEEADLEARVYLAVRAAGGGIEEQRRIVSEFWEVIGKGNRLTY